MNELLMQLGTNARPLVRRQIFERVVPDLVKVGILPLHEAVGDVAAARSRLASEMMTLETMVQSVKSTRAI
jgi:hypothetical protein